MDFWKWKSVFHQKIILHRDDSVDISFVILDNFLENFWINMPFSLYIKSLKRRKKLPLSPPAEAGQAPHLRGKRRMSRGSCIYNIHSFRNIYFYFIFSPHISVFCYFFFFKSSKQVSEGIVKIIWIYISRKKISKYSVFFHL